jgi:ribosomal RNA-processing protein 7
MQAYEEAEGAKRRAQEAARSQPDDDGFVTVSYATAVGSKEELEESATATTPSRRKGNKRSRKKKQAAGSQELHDFYRFQRKEGRKRTMEELRKQFDEDLKKVKRRKEEKQYRPF